MNASLITQPFLWHLCWFVDALRHSGNRDLWEFLLQRIRLQIDGVADEVKRVGSEKENEDPSTPDEVNLVSAKEAHLEDKTGSTSEANSDNEEKEPAPKKLRILHNDEIVQSNVIEEVIPTKNVL